MAQKDVGFAVFTRCIIVSIQMNWIVKRICHSVTSFTVE